MSTNDILRGLVSGYDDEYICDPIEPDCVQTEPGDLFEVDYDSINAQERTKQVHEYASDKEETMETSETSEATTESSMKTRKKRWASELGGLQFTNPGDKTSKMLPDSLDIIDRSRSRRAAATAAIAEGSQQNVKDEGVRHDKAGRTMYTVKGGRKGHDLCDCLVMNCNGCQWPCKQCRSRKCMIGCRQGRKDIIGRIEAMYTVTGNTDHVIVQNPFYLYPIKH